MATQQQYDQLIAAFEDGGGNTAKELRDALSAFRDDLLGLKQNGAALIPLFGGGAPSSAIGSNGQTYTNTVNGYVYQKQAGAWQFQYIAKGKDGSTPRAGIDYQQPGAGADGEDGNRIHDKNYAPRTSDNASVGGQANLEGDQWFYTISLSSYERYAFLAGQWTLVFRKAESAASAPATNQAPTLTQASPASGPAGTQIVLTGTNLSGAIVAFNGTAAAPISNTATQIVVNVPTGATTGNITATTSNGSATLYFVVTVPATTTPANQAPTVTIAGSSSTVNTGQSVTLTASPYDADGTIAKVEYFDNGVKVGETTSAPHSILTPGLSQGAHSFTARATDDKGATGISATPFSVSVSTPQTVYNGSYTARCGVDKAGTGSDVTRTAQGATQAEADAAARNAAIAALVCTVSQDTPVVYTAQSSDFHNNAYDESISGTTARRRSALAYVTHQFSNGLPAYADIRFVAPVHGTTSPSSQIGIAVLTDGNYTGMATAASKAEQTVRLTFSVASGSHTLTFGEGLQEELSNLNFAGCHIIDITYPANTAYTVVAPDLSKPPFFFDTDSIGVGVGATIAQTHAFIVQVAQYLTGFRCIALGAGRRRIDTSYDTDAKRTGMLDRMAAYGGNMSGAAHSLQMTYNDAGSGGTVANSSAIAGTWLDAIKGRFPNMIRVVQTALPSTNDSTLKLPDWRTALAKVGNDRSIKVIDGLSLLDNPAPGVDTVDGIHPGSGAISAKYAPRWLAAYNAKAVLGQPLILHGWEGNNSGARWEDIGGGGNHAIQDIVSRQPSFNGTVFGKKAALFTQDTLQFMMVNALAQQSGAYTIIFTCRSTSAQTSQFIFDTERGRIAAYAKGLDNDQSGYYSAATGGTISGVRGVRFNAEQDTFVAIVLGATSSTMIVNDTVTTGIPPGVTRFQTSIRLGAAIDKTDANGTLGRFFGPIGCYEVWPGELTLEQINVRKAIATTGGSGGGGSTQDVLIQQTEASTPNGVTRTETNTILYSGGTGFVLSQLNQTVIYPARTMTGFQLVSPKANGVGHVLVTMRDSSGNVVHQVSVDISQAASTPTNSAVVYTSPTFASAAYTITCQIDPAYPSAIFVDAIIANGVPV